VASACRELAAWTKYVATHHHVIVTSSQALVTRQNEHRAVVHQYAAFLFVTVFSLIGAFPFHLLSGFALGAAIQFRRVSPALRFIVGAVSFGLLVLGLAPAVVLL
jgi:uncharacterized membrane protein